MSGDDFFQDLVNSDLDPWGQPRSFNNNPMDQAYAAGLYGDNLNTAMNSQNRNHLMQPANAQGLDMHVNPQDIMAGMNGNTSQAYHATSPNLTPPGIQPENTSGGSSTPKFDPSSDGALMNTGFAASGDNHQAFSADIPSSPPGITATDEGWPGWVPSEYRSQQPTAPAPEPNQYPAPESNQYPAAPNSFAPSYGFDWDQTKQSSLAPASNNVPASGPTNMVFNAMPMTTGASSSGRYVPIAPMPQATGASSSGGYVPIAPMPHTTGNFGTTPAPPTRAAPKSRKPAANKVVKKSTNKGKQQAVRFPIFRNQLLVSTLAEAEETAIQRIALKVVDDDRDDVAAHPEVWLPRITQAFDVALKDLPEDANKFTEEGHTEFRRWQEEHLNKVYGILGEHGEEDAPKFGQSCAYFFFELVLDSHRKGVQQVAKTIANGGANLTMKCSERIMAAIKALEGYSIVRYDFLNRDRLEGLVASPEGFVRRKVENMFVNYKKKPGTGPVRVEEPKVPKVRKATKAKSTKKSKAEPLEVDDHDNEDEDEVDDDAEDATYEEAKRPRKRAKRT